MNQLIDTHAHLYYNRFKADFDEVIQRTLNVNLTSIINIGADLESSQKALDLESDKIKFYSSIGLHPHASKIISYESIHENIKKLHQIYQSMSAKIVALGECGLDFYFEGDDGSSSLPSKEILIKVQKELFLAQIILAKELNLPIIIHCRDAWSDIFVPELVGATGVFHSFTSNWEDAKKALNLGYYLSFSCIVTYPKNETLRQTIKKTPLDKILTETDSPYLPPQNLRGQRNEPANVIEVAKVIAEMKNISYEEATQATYQNAQKLFKLT